MKDKKAIFFLCLPWVLLAIAFCWLGIRFMLADAPWPQSVFSFCMVGVMGLRCARTVYRYRRMSKRDDDQ